MELALSLKNQYLLSEQDKCELDTQIDYIIGHHKNNAYQISKLVFDSVNALTVSEVRISELRAQSSLKRIWGGLIGKNRRLQSEIDKDLARAQYCSQQTIQKLAEQNLMSFELITAVNNKLNSSIIEIGNEINDIYTILINFFKQNKSDIIKIENRLDKIEKNLNLLNWINSIEYKMVDGIEYSELDNMEKISRAVVDFYEMTNGKWSNSDLLLLKSAISNIGLSPRENIKYIDFIRYICEHEKLYDLFFNLPVEILDKINNDGNIVTDAIIKYKLLYAKENYIVGTINEILNLHEAEEDIDNLRYLIVKKYEEQRYSVDICKEVNVFDFSLELLLNIAILKDNLDNLYRELDFDNMEFNEVSIYANYGVSEAQCKIGDMYRDGDKVEQNYKEALKWYILSAEQENDRAQYNIGNIYYYGRGLEQNYKEALKWYGLSSEQGNDEAQLQLGYMYDTGTGVEKNDYEAFRLYKLSAEKGNSTSQSNLGLMYSNGRGTDKDINEAIKFYKLSAEQENSYGQANLGWAYYWGIGIEKDTEKSYYWIKKSAQQGNAWAKERLEEWFNEVLE